MGILSGVRSSTCERHETGIIPAVLRRLSTFLSLVSLLLCIATCVLWVRSYTWMTIARYTYVTHEEVNVPGAFPPAFQDAEVTTLRISPGTITLSRDVNHGSGISTGTRVRHLPTDSVSYAIADVGFRQEDRVVDGVWMVPGLALHMPPNGTTRTLHVRSSLLAFLFALMPAIYVTWRWSCRRNKVLGRCPVCGYDIRASPQRCPECGTAPAGATPRI